MNKRPIGVFDSGVGGLTVLKELKKNLPNENFIYFGDTKRVPYGDKPIETLITFANQITNFLLSKDVKLIVVACNTITSIYLEELQSICPVPVFGVIEPGVKMALACTKNKNIGIIGTSATIKSGVHKKNILSYSSDINIWQKACPLFVPLIENNASITEILPVAKDYLNYFRNKKLDTLILGCTHYPVLSDVINLILPNTSLINPAIYLSQEIENYIQKNNISNIVHTNNTRIEYFLSGDISNFELFLNKFMNEVSPNIRQINIENF